MLSYSKAPRGLFVLVELGRVFTANAISPSRGLRQLLTRYAFRAGRNLPDEGLRYRRTVQYVIPIESGTTILRRLHIAMQIGLYHPRSCKLNVA